ncbi:hypothetical protein [Terriglobus albidus]|uniref:hypothetical protein n=1 Tax=Terriglobus albidus TaxID=1592106 RepID=UPI0021DF6DCE|nr:hypothetical protein [Terriglobus albidus]
MAIAPDSSSSNIASQAASAKRPLPFSAPGRLDVIAPQHSLRLAEENEITLRPRVAGLTEVETLQVQYIPDRMASQPRAVFPKEGWAILPLLYHSDGSASIRVIPRSLGRLALRITARFPDGGETESEIAFDVRLTEQSPEKIVVGSWFDPTREASWEFTYLDPKELTRGLAISASYKDVKGEFNIDPSFASFHVRPENNARPAIDIDGTKGAIKPLHVGEALVETSFGGWTSLTCVIVKDHNDSNFRNQGCKSLLRPGEEIGRSIRK